MSFSPVFPQQKELKKMTEQSEDQVVIHKHKHNFEIGPNLAQLLALALVVGLVISIFLIGSGS